MEDKEAKVKSWEKPWTTDEIRDQSSRWNLAGDAGLLKTLEQFAEDLTTRSNVTLKKLNTLVNDLEQTSSDVSNVTNTFLLLANKQFFENRVKDDDDPADVQKAEDKRAADEKAKPEPQSDPKERVRDALTKGMEFLDTMFSSVELVVGSDSEEEEDSLTSAGHLLKPINPYTSRPLPCLIGSREFFEDDHVGLRAQSDEDEESGELDEDESVQSSDSEEENNQALPPDLLQRKKISTPSESENSQPESEQSGVPDKKKHHGDQMFGQESPPEAEVSSVPTQNTAQKSFAAELAAKLGGVAAADNKTPVNVAQNSSRPPAPKEKPDIYAQTRKHFDDLFGPSSDDEDDSLFGSGGKYSGGRGLFDDDDVEDWKKPPPAKNLWEEPAEVSKSKDVPSKVPDLAVENPSSLFDGEDADHSIFSSPSMSNSTRARNRADSSVSEVKTSTPNQEGDSLFGLINDFQNLSAIHAVPRPQSDQSGAKDSGLQSDFSGQTTFKKPAGGVSIFGNMAVNASMLAGKLQSTSSKEATAENNVAVIVSGSSTSGVDSNTASKSIKSVSGNSSAGPPPQARDSLPQASKAHIKDDDDAVENLFKKGTANAQSSQSNGTGKSSTSATTTTKKPLSLFDDLDSEDDDLLFSSTGSTGSRSRQSIDVLESRKSQFPIMPKKNIFNDEDLLFGGEVGGGGSSNFDIFGAKGDSGKGKVSIDSVPNKGGGSVLKGDSLEVGGGSDFDIFGAKTEAGKSKVSIDTIPDKSSKSVVKGDSLAGLLEADGGSDFDIFGAKSEAGKKKVAVDTVPDKNEKGDSLAGSLGKGSNPTLPSSENIGEKSGKDSKLDDLSWLDDADTGDIFSDLNTKAEQLPPTVCKEPTLHSDLFSDKLFDNIADEGDSFLSSVVTPKPRTIAAVSKVEPSALEPAKLSEKPAEKPKPVAVARTVAAPKMTVAQENLAPSEKFARGEKPTVAPRKSGTATTAAKREVEKSNEGRESPGLFKGSAGLSQPESDSNAKHSSSAKQFDEDDLFKIVPAVPAARPPVKPEPPKTLNIRQTADVSASLDADDLFNDGPLRGDNPTTTTVVPPETVGALPTKQRKPVLGGDTTDGTALRGPTDLRGNKEALLAAANVAEKSDAPSEPLRPSPKLKLNIDPLALLPGAKPPTRAERMEKAANFDSPAPDLVATLPSAGKDRVKIQVKRRPQTRRARQEAIRASLIENEDGSFGGDDVPAAAASEESPVKELPVPVTETVPKTSLLVTEPEDKSPPSEDLPRERILNNPKLLLPSSNPLSPSTDEEDFFGVPPDLPSDYGNPKDCNGNLFGDAPVLSPLDLGSVRTFTTERSGEDLFATSGDDNRNTLGSKMVSAAPPPGSLFDATENGNLGDTQKRSTEDDPLAADQPPIKGAESFEDVPDLFGPKVPARTTSKTLQDLFPTVKKESAVKDEDNSLFRGANNVTKTQPPGSSLFSGSDEEDYEDLFSLERPQTRRKKADKAKEAKPAPKLFADPPSKSSNDLPKTNNPPKGADRVPNSKAGIQGPEGIFTSALPKTSLPKGADGVLNSKGPEGIFASALPPEKERIFSNDHLNGGGQPVHKKKAKAAPIIPGGNLDDDNLFPTNSAAYPSSKSSLGSTGKGGAKKGASLFGDDSPESEDLFGSISSSSSSSKKAPPPAKVAASSESSRTVQPTKPANKMQRSIFDDDDEEDIFSKASSKSSSSSNISQSFLGALADPYDLFANVPTSRTAGKAQKQQGGGTSSRVKVNEKEDVFEDPLMALKK